jgi:hypothetical protein
MSDNYKYFAISLIFVTQVQATKIIISGNLC